jgi:prepilin-type N-terminal cleavage/methylation domain-containing protein
MRTDYKHRESSDARNGFTLMELAVAVSVFAVLLATSMKMVTLVSHQARVNEQRRIALQTMQSLSEQIGNIPWDNLPAAASNQLPLPESAVAHLPDAQLKIAVNDETDPIAKRIVVEITWKGSGADRAGPVQLTSWVFPDNSAPVP